MSKYPHSTKEFIEAWGNDNGEINETTRRLFEFYIMCENEAYQQGYNDALQERRL
ncbi:MAG: hypothetical protein GXZ14_09195 [Ruminococcaceae bacterium]|nr:hypothetical protein [Oscillospiraceae bacterium]